MPEAVDAASGTLRKGSDLKLKRNRIWMSMAGVLIGAVSVGFFKLAAFGVDPFQSLVSGLDQWVPLDYGTLYVLINGILLLFSLVCDRHYIGIATMINLFLLGYVVQFSYDVLRLLFPQPELWLRGTAFAVGFVGLCFGSSLYMTADLGVSTYDAIALIFTGTWKLGAFKMVRILTDLICVLLGVFSFLMGGGSLEKVTEFVGIGTIVTAFFMGPLIDLMNRRLAIPLLNRTQQKSART